MASYYMVNTDRYGLVPLSVGESPISGKAELYGGESICDTHELGRLVAYKKETELINPTTPYIINIAGFDAFSGYYLYDIDAAFKSVTRSTSTKAIATIVLDKSEIANVRDHYQAKIRYSTMASQAPNSTSYVQLSSVPDIDSLPANGTIEVSGLSQGGTYYFVYENGFTNRGNVIKSMNKQVILCPTSASNDCGCSDLQVEMVCDGVSTMATVYCMCSSQSSSNVTPVKISTKITDISTNINDTKINNRFATLY